MSEGGQRERESERVYVITSNRHLKFRLTAKLTSESAPVDQGKVMMKRKVLMLISLAFQPLLGQQPCH